MSCKAATSNLFYKYCDDIVSRRLSLHLYKSTSLSLSASKNHNSTSSSPITANSVHPGSLRCVLLHHRKIIWRFCPHLFLVPLWNKAKQRELFLFSHPWQRFVSPQLSYFFFLSYVLSKFPVSFIHSPFDNFFCKHTRKKIIFESLLVKVLLVGTCLSLFHKN